jgi:hypothetical protein
MSERNGTYLEVPDADGGMSAPCATFHKAEHSKEKVF